MITLLTIVRTINDGKLRDDIPPLQGNGSKEVHQVYTSFAKLFKILRISNVAFFGRNLLSAHSFTIDALKLFRKVGDDKAVRGIFSRRLYRAYTRQFGAMWRNLLTNPSTS